MIYIAAVHTQDHEAELLANPRIGVILSVVFVEQLVQDTAIEMCARSFEAFSAVFRILRVDLVVVEFDASVAGHDDGFVEISVSFEEIWTTATHFEM